MAGWFIPGGSANGYAPLLWTAATLAALAQTLNSPMVFAIRCLGFAVTLGVFKLREARSDSDYSVTTVMAGPGVLELGGLAVIGDAQAEAAGGTALAATLASRNVLHHGFLKRLTWMEPRSALMLAVMTAVVLLIDPAAIVATGPAAATAAIVFAGSALAIFYWRQDKPFADVPASNPFEIGPLPIFAAAAIASAVLVSRFGNSGNLATPH